MSTSFVIIGMVSSALLYFLYTSYTSYTRDVKKETNHFLYVNDDYIINSVEIGENNIYRNSYMNA